MTDMTQTGLARFYQRYDTRHRLLFVGALGASLALSAVAVAHGVDGIRPHGAAPAAVALGMGVIFPPFAIAAWWTAQEFIARWRDRRPPMSADDAPNGLRIANAGFLFSLALVACVLGSQAVSTFAALGYAAGEWILRATGVGMGLALICLGNVWPRLPTLRVPGRRTAKEMKINRLWGWIMVILGLGALLSGLFPLLHPLPGARP